jgi:hypothetical protein
MSSSVPGAAFVQPEQDGDRDIGGRTPGAAFLSAG